MKDEAIIELIKMEGTATRGLIRSEIDRIHEMDEKRNGRIQKLETETRWTRWMARNPKVAIAIFISGVALVILGFNAINVRRTAEKVLNIELKENEP
jgi:hypothetical protein